MPIAGQMVAYVPSEPQAVERMLQLAEIKPSDTVYDLGCGDGRIVIAAVRDFGARKGVGVEIQEDLVEQARERVRREGLTGRVEIIHASLLDVDLSRADVLVLYLSPTVNEFIRPKLERELKEGARVISRSFIFQGWTPEREESVSEEKLHLYLYRMKRRPRGDEP